ncbi:MAG: tRNA preQ1(34) S-adenosylmethionine ribosyltransferase-isomerase QueA [Gomphosphaeria aponina SAG 52.96 = DSM 107014]|uniref:S-adenosylmethionine:tRNA ribosyltransferase-isomerase n=1 Tax=Gomphosphaeria aponina SAG 52.96 = DSM 107014 TaxID=1521640 RepID=A0A941GUD7_9CHRO|nr:tRNA preQ1(34) S-adenosylmethionine ribosyltransferase-isomerase QueA [Gomphosphaeria aponina SAG 52.96 = DSM 107014]
MHYKNPDQLLSNYDYQLPPELIAQTPAIPRDSSRLLIVFSNTHTHGIFRDLPNWLLAGDLLVLNNTRVIPARLYGRKSTGARLEILLLEEKQNNCWLALVKPGKRFKLGSEIIFDELGFLKATVLERDQATGGRILQFQIPTGKSFWDLLEQLGEIPLPPYITSSEASPSQYQTVYAVQPGAVAAPTAGLHFTKELLEGLAAEGINQAYVTLHVGVGTFRPVEVKNITTHTMHQEWVEVSEETVAAIEKTKARGGRIIAVGTTVVRALEGAAASGGLLPFRGFTDLFIYPGYQWRVVDGLITNFHLPRSSLLMLVSALVGRERLLALYVEAIAHQYRFYSFGDAMLILPA